MTKITITTLLILCSFIAHSQQRVALQHNGTTTIFDGSNPFAVAYDSAVSGDTIYIPGGVFAPPTSIGKRLHIYGTGHFPDTTTATGKTIISGSFNFSTGSDSSFIEGLETTGSVQIYSNQKVDYITISRCKIPNLVVSGNLTTPCNHLTLKQSIVDGYIDFSNATYCLVTNNIIKSNLVYGNNNAFYNNIFLYDGYYYYYLITSMSNCHFANNIMRKNSPYLITGNLNTFSNNALPIANPGGTNTYIDNFFNQPFDSLFTDSIPPGFEYDTDYHLDSASNYLGTDSTQIGIYGGLYPWKKSSVPSIPHIIYKNIPFATEPNGTLDIEIKVNAEDY